jgi:hypothetical protein
MNTAVNCKREAIALLPVCRSASEELKQLGVRVEEKIDITSDASVTDLRDRLG